MIGRAQVPEDTSKSSDEKTSSSEEGLAQTPSSTSSSDDEKAKQKMALAAFGAAESAFNDDKNDPRSPFFNGVAGKPLKMAVNFYPVLDPSSQFHLYSSDMKYRQYNVIFGEEKTFPRSLRIRAIDAIPDNKLPKSMFSFDGVSNVYVKEEGKDFAKKYEHLTAPCTIPVKIKMFDGKDKTIDIQLNPVREVNPGSHQCVMTIINSTLKRALCKHTSLVMFARCLYDTANKVKVNFAGQTYFAVPGYDVSINRCRNGYFLNLDNRFRIFRAGDVHKSVYEAFDFDQRRIKEYLTGRVVYNTKSGKLFRVDEIDSSTTPRMEFDYKGRIISVAEYYREKWGEGAKIQHMDSALLIEIDRRTQKKACIPPEFCLITGLDANEKSNFGLMKALTGTTKPNASQKVDQLRIFAQKYFAKPAEGAGGDAASVQMKIYDELCAAGVSIQAAKNGTDQMVEIPARLLQPPLVKFANSVTVRNSYDWGRDFRDVKPYRISEIVQRGVILGVVCTKRDEQNVRSFLQGLSKTTGQLGCDFTQKHRYFYPKSPRADDFKQVLDEVCAMNKATIILIALPDDRKDRYDAIKNSSLINEFPVPTQCIKTRTMSKGLSVATKVAHQMYAKLGCGLWSVIPGDEAKLLPMMRELYGKAMVVGVDVHHDPSKKGSVMAVVGSLDSNHTRFGARTKMQGTGKEMEKKSPVPEMIWELAVDRCNNHGSKLSQIIVYRDGVSRGREETLYGDEIIGLENLIESKRAEGKIPKNMLDETGAIKIIYILVNKSHGLKMFEKQDRRVNNPRIGSVLDRETCRATHADFYMVTATTREGMVSPVHYEMVHPRINNKGKVVWKATDHPSPYVEPTGDLQADTVQAFTFYTCYGYYNMTSPIRVPAACQYAHKLALICGAHIHNAVSTNDHQLKDLLWYL